MKNRLLKVGGIFLISTLMLISCDQEYDALNNSIYFGEAQNIDSKNVTVEENGAKTAVYLSLAAPVDKQVVAEVVSDPKVLEDFNKKHGTNYMLLPDNYFNLDNNKCTIEAGKLSSPMININIKPFDDNLEISSKYAIPIRIVSADGVNLLKSSAKMVLLCDKVIHTKVLFGTYSLIYEVKENDPLTDNLEAYTIEFLTNSTTFSLNKHILRFTNEQGRVSIFSRFGEYDHPVDEIQVKIENVPLYGGYTFSSKKWYHVAIVSDGSTVKLYQNGKLDLAASHPEPNAKTSWRKFDIMRHNHGALSEFRIWKVARSQAEITNNMYAVSPKSEGLISYWKFDDFESDKIVDQTGNGRDLPMPRGGEWRDQKFPPEN